MLKLKYSGYSEKFRREICDSILNAFENIVSDDKNGVKPIFRSKDWNREERQKLKLNRKYNWWNHAQSKIQYKSVLFVTPTPGGVLAKDVRKREAEINKNSDERIKIVEKGGSKIRDMLATKNSDKKSECSKKKCPLCKSSKFVEINPKGNQYPCNTNNVGYWWHCLICRQENKTKVDEGESSRSARIRGLEHLSELEKKNEKSVLYKHISSQHPKGEVKFQMEMTQKFRDALTRQANEAVRIYTRPDNELLNSKSEFNHPPMARVVVQNK